MLKARWLNVIWRGSSCEVVNGPHWWGGFNGLSIKYKSHLHTRAPRIQTINLLVSGLNMASYWLHRLHENSRQITNFGLTVTRWIYAVKVQLVFFFFFRLIAFNHFNKCTVQTDTNFKYMSVCRRFTAAHVRCHSSRNISWHLLLSMIVCSLS